MDIKNGRFKTIYAISIISVWVEHLLRAFWPVFFGVILLFGLALLGFTPFIPAGIFQILFFLIIFLGISYGAAQFITPTDNDIERRLTQANNLPFNPFRLRRDHPAHDLHGTQNELWLSAQNQSAHNINRLFPPFPRPRLAEHDPKGLRFIALLILCVGLLHSAGNTANILSKTFIPIRPDAMKPASVDIWLTPPDYTGLAPVRINTDDENPVSIPEGTTVNAFVSKGFFTPNLATNRGQKPFIKAQDGGYTVEYTLNPQDKILKIKSGLITDIKTHLIQIPDIKPIISLVQGPEATENKTVAMRFVGRDDYGIETVEFIMTPDPMIAYRLGDPAPYTQDFQMGGQEFIDQERSLTLYDHPWAGLPVIVKLKATDTKGQYAQSNDVHFILPEKEFTHPLARRLAEIRKELFWNADLDTMRIFAAQLFTLQSRLAAYNGKIDIYMGLGAAGYRLLNMKQTRGPSMTSLRQLLWDMALRIEGGSSRVAAENLQNTLAEVAQALQNPNLNEQEFQALQQKLEKAISEYMQSLMNELAAQLQEQGVDSMPDGFEDMVQQEINPGDFMQELRDKLQNGSREEIAEALQQMQNMIGQMKDMQFKPMTQEMKDTLAEVAKLKDLITKQEELLDETRSIAPDLPPRTTQDYAEEMPQDNSIFDQQDKMPPMPSDDNSREFSKTPALDIPTVESGAQADTQQSIQGDLGKIQERLESLTGKNADFMTRAGKAMENSKNALNADRPDQSIPHQERAIRELKNGMKNSMKDMASGLGKVLSLGLPPMARGQNPGDGPRDPFGRKLGNNGDITGKVNMSDEQDRRRIQDIRDKILDNADDVDDDPLADDYFDNLLERF